MGIALPQLAPASEDRASGAQVIDGSLKFDKSKSNHLRRNTGSAGNRKTWTWSSWVKRSGNDTLFDGVFGADLSTAQRNNINVFFYNENDASNGSRFSIGDGNGAYLRTTQVFRDLAAWGHLLIIADTTLYAANDRIKIYWNGVRIREFAENSLSSNVPFNSDLGWNTNTIHVIGGNKYNGTYESYLNGHQSNVYFIDGQALGPGYFGYTDGLTGTWRPKKFRAEGTTINDGTVWSNSLTTNAGDNFDASGPKVDAFDGDSTDKCYTANNSDGTTQNTSYIQFNSPVVLNGDVEIYVDNGNAVFSVDSSGGLTLLGKNTSGSDNQRVGLGYIQTSKLRVLMEGGSRPAIGAISVDGVTMIDSTTTNLDFGTNGFYLPMDGNSPIGEDQSGKGNNWTPQNFGGSVALPKATGAKPILNTDGGGNVARPGVFGSEVGAYYAVTVASVGGGNRYHFDGVDRPNPTLIRGATYTFDQSDSSNSTHPLRFATAADAAGSSQYTDGVTTNGTPGSAGAYTKITVPHNSPNTLHYYCTNHGGMGSSTSQTTDETKADPYAWKCVLATPLVGGIDDVSADINATTTKKAATNYGSTDSSVISNFYGSSRKFDGSNDNINLSLIHI